MASQNVQFDNFEHIIRTSAQWNEGAICNYAIPRGVLCIELFPDGITKLKVGEGNKFYRQLPYVGGDGGDLSNYYTKEQIDRIITNLKAVSIPSTNIYPNKELLPKTGNKLGEIRFVANPGSQDPATYLWNDSRWIALGGIFDADLSEYVKKKEIMPIVNRLELAAHTHANKSVLDQTDAPYTQAEKVKLRDLQNYDDSEIKSDIASLTAKAHTHNNIDVLNETNASYTTEEKQKLASLHDYTPFEGATATGNGSEGLVPAPTSADRNKFLSGDGTWKSASAGSIEPATTETLGGIIVGDNLSIDENGVLSAVLAPPYQLPIAAADTLGGIKVGDNLTIDSYGVLSATDTIYTLPIADASTLGGIKVGANLSIDANGVLSTHAPYSLPIASNNTLGGVKIGSNLSIDANGVLSADAQQYVLPTASQSTLGGVKVGDGLMIDQDGVLSTTGGGGGASVGLVEGPGIDLDVVVEEIQITALRFYITDRRSGGDSYMQFAELEFQDSSNNVITFSNVAGYIGDTSNPITYPGSGEDVSKLFDGSSSTKMCCNWNGSGIRIDMTLPSTIVLSTISGYRFMTANDSSNRDPSKWVVYALTTTNDWILIDEQDSAVVPTARRTYTEKFPVGDSHVKTKVTNTGVLGVSVSNGVMTVTDKDGDTQYSVGGGGSGTEYVAGDGISIDEGDTTNDITSLAWEQGSISHVNGENDDLITTAIRSPFIETGLTQMVNVSAQDTDSIDMVWKAAFYDSSHNFISMTSTWQTISGDDTRPQNAQYVRIILRKSNETVIDENDLSYCEISWPIEIGKYVITNTGVTHIEMNGSNLQVVEDGITSEVLQFSNDFQVTSGEVTIPDYQNLVLHVITPNQ